GRSLSRRGRGRRVPAWRSARESSVRSFGFLLWVAEDREDHQVVIRPLAIKLVPQLSFLHEAMRLEDVLRALVVVEHVDAQLAQVHLIEREPHQRADGVAAEAAVPRARLADEEAEG